MFAAALRALSFAVGTLLLFAPVFLMLSFAYGVGEPPKQSERLWFTLPLLAAGAAIGGGPLLAGIPGLVVGSRRPATQGTAGVLIVVSALAILFIGFSGTVTAIVSPAILLIEAAAFYYFVFPATRYHVAIDGKGEPMSISANDA
jgi:hypothetical protein